MTFQHVLQAFKLTRTMALIYGLSITSVLFVTRTVLQELTRVPEVTEDLWALLKSNFDNFSQLLNQNEVTSTLTLGLFWGMVGAITYFVLTNLSKGVFGVKNVVDEELAFVQPEKSHIIKDRLMLAERIMVRLSIIILIMLITSVWIQLLLPISLQVFDLYLRNWTNVAKLAETLVSISGLCLSVHAIVALAKLLLLKPQY